MKRFMRTEDDVLELDVDKLENRLMLAADVSVSGQNVTIVGDDAPNSVEIFESGGTIWVDADGESQDTGLASIQNLKITMKDSVISEEVERLSYGADFVEISNDVLVTGKTTIKLGGGPNELYLGGLHNKVKVVGGKGSDYVFLNGGIGVSKNVISLKGGDDVIALDVGEYADAALSDTPLSDYLFSLELDESILGAIPSIKGKLGGGNDEFRVQLYGDDVTNEDILNGVNLIADELGLEDFDNLEEAAALVSEAAAEFGIKIPQFVKLNGGGGIDAMVPGDAAVVFDLVGSQKGFEEFVNLDA